MNEQTKTFGSKFWAEPRRFFAWLTILSLVAWLGLGLFIREARKDSDWGGHPHWNDFRIFSTFIAICAVFVVALPGLILSSIPRTRPAMSWALRRWLFCGAAVVTLIVLFYAEENWRGQRALERAKQAMVAKGFVLDWDKFYPPAVPDAQNVFKAPKMQEWFVRTDDRTKSNELTGMFQGQTNFPVWGDKRQIESESEARAYLAWSDQLQPQFTMIHDALKRPYARMDGDYANMMTLPFPNFIAIREVARILAQRTHCYLLVHEPDKAVAELALMHDLSHLLDCKPTGKPMTLVGAMINVAVVGLYADVIGDGFRMHAWREQQLVKLQKQLSEIHVMIPVAAAFESEPAASTRALETVPINRILDGFGEQHGNLFRIAPRGWVLQNIANEIPYSYARTEAFEVEQERVRPDVLRDSEKRFEDLLRHRSLFNVLAAMMIPNINKAAQITARNQTAADEALIACALERYRMANGSYPDSLDALVPKFLEKLPHDIITGEPLKYHRGDNSFVLYSIGWNEKDDGGMAGPVVGQGRPDATVGDWVWQYAAK